MNFSDVKPGMWLHESSDIYFYTVYLVKSKKDNYIKWIRVSNKDDGGYTLVVEKGDFYLSRIPIGLEDLSPIDKDIVLHFYGWLFQWIFDTSMRRKIDL